MLIVPRLTEMVVALLADDPLLADARVLPGGIWRDLLPQESRAYPAIIVTYVFDAPNVTQPKFVDVQLEVRGEIDGWDLDPLRGAMDRVDDLLRTATRYVAAGAGEWAGIKFNDALRISHIQRTTVEASGGALFGHLGGLYAFTCSEPAPVPVE